MCARAILGNRLPLLTIRSNAYLSCPLSCFRRTKGRGSQRHAQLYAYGRKSMSNDDIAAAVLECVGGFSNVISDSLCATRLRISLHEVAVIDRNALQSINGVLGIANRGANGIEVVFGPNLVRGVFESFKRLVGPKEHTQDISRHHEAPPRKASNFQVSITPETPGMPVVQLSNTVEDTPLPEDDGNEANELLTLLSESPAFEKQDVDDLDDLEDDSFADPVGPHLLVINGPTLNMLGIREPELYGTSDYSALLALCHQSAAEAGFADCECYQSNHEGDLIDRIQDAYGDVDAILINPGPFAHTSIALLDALKAVQIPAIEVHLTNLAEREEFRRFSYTSLACLKTIDGLGLEGYRQAIFELAEHLR